jgi:PPOX class probable F420-dependent enzyme
MINLAGDTQGDDTGGLPTNVGQTAAMDVSAALAFAREGNKGVFVTIRRDGRPQVSNVLYVVDGTSLTVSLTVDRAKTKNLLRDPRACMHITDASFWRYAVLDGTVSLSAPAKDPNDSTADALVAYYRASNGEHPDWDEYRAAMVAEGRLVATLEVTSAYGQI